MENISALQQVQENSGEYRTPFSVDLDDMLDPIQIEQYLKRFRSIPLSANIKSVMENFSTAEWIEDTLGKRFTFTKEQKRGVTRVIRDVLLGDLDMRNMTSTLSSQYGISSQVAQDITKMIVTELFAPAMEDIKKIQQEKFGNTPPPVAQIRPATGIYKPTPTPPSLSEIQGGAGQVQQVPTPSSQDLNTNSVIDLRNKPQ